MSAIDVFNVYFSASTAIFLTAFGLLGNSIVLFVYTRKRFRNITMFRYYSFSVIFETLELLLIWPFNFSEFFQFNNNRISCKMVQYLAYLFTQCVSWISVLIAIDRYLSAKSVGNSIRKKRSFQIAALTTIFLVSSLIYAPFFVFNDIIIDLNNSSYCGVEDTFTSIFMDASDFIISALIPFIIMIAASCLVGLYLVKNRIKLNKKKMRKEIRLLKILIGMDIFFFLCYFPWSAFVLTNDFLTLEGLFIDYMSIVYNVTNFIIFLYCSCSFVIHFISNKKFRSYLLCSSKKSKYIYQNKQQTGTSSSFPADLWKAIEN